MTVDLSRRRFLQAASLTACSAAAGALLPTRYAFAAAGPAYTGDTLVVLSLRGAADWLSLVPPLGDPAYAAARPTIAVPPASAAPLNQLFGLHPAMSPLLPLYQSGVLGVVHAVGNPDATRSHFDATRLQELAGVAGTGWLERATAASGPAAAARSLAAVHLGSASPPIAQAGGPPPTAMTTLGSFSLYAPTEGYRPAARALTSLYARDHTQAGAAARDVLGSLDVVSKVSALPAGAAYPNTRTATTLADIARLVRSGVGLQVATLDVGGWDMHANLGRAGGGQMAARASELAGALAAFAADLGPLLGRVTLVTLTEFGRRVAENGNAGLDHGHGYAMVLLGGAVNGGQVLGSWPGLAGPALDNGDLQATTDYRVVLAEVLRSRCGIDPAAVFPGLPPGQLGVVRPR